MVMAERRKNKKKKEAEMKDMDEKPSKEEYAVARYLKQKLPEKKTTLLGHKVEYFIACKAIDCLVESPWAKENRKGPLSFSNRDIAADFMARLLNHKFFHRAQKIVVTKEPKKKKKDEEAAQDSGKEKDKDSKKPKSKTNSEKTECKDSQKVDTEDSKKADIEDSKKTDAKDSKKTDAKDSKKTDTKDSKKIDTKDSKKDDSKDSKKCVGCQKNIEKKKEKKKIKLDMHLEQIFIDSNEPYVWIYDPIPLRTWITGTLMVIAAVLLCLFPLWPQSIRHYIYYLSVAAAFFLVFIIGLAVLRLVVFVIVWVVTFGKHHIWLLPNLTEDVGFFESFWPLYKYEYKASRAEKDKKESPSKKKKSHKNGSGDEKLSEKDASKESGDSKEESAGEEQEDGDEKKAEQSQSDSEPDKSEEQNENGFEFVEAEEVGDEVEEEDEKEEDRKTK